MILLLSFLLHAEPKKDKAAPKKPVKVYKSELGYETILVEVSPFLVGAIDDAALQDMDEKAYLATLKHSFFMGQKEVSRGFWRSIMGTDPNSREGSACLR